MAVAFVLLQIAVVLVCIGLRQMPLPRPPEAFRLQDVSVVDLSGQQQPVTLPDHQATAGLAVTSVTYLAAFNWPAGRADQALAVFLPRYTTAISIAVNGHLIADTLHDIAARRPDRNMPAFAPIPRSLLSEGRNEVTVRLLVWGPLSGYLDSIYVGPDENLRRAYDLRHALFDTLPIILAAWQLTFGIILGIIWLNRRREPIYGLLAAAILLGVIQQFVGLPRTPMMAGLLGATVPIEGALMLHYTLLFTGRQIRRWHALAFLPGLLIILAALFVSQESLRMIYLVLGPTSVGILIATVWLLLLTGVWHSGQHTIYLATAFTAALVCWTLDVLTINQMLPGERLFIGRLSYSLVLIALGIWLIWRFVQALKEADGFAAVLVDKIAHAEEKLRAHFAQEEARARGEALIAERTRLMRDLHDGLGGQLVSIVALSERPQPSGAAIGEAARAALKDLRLVIDAMEDIDGDLMLALASWRERIDAQLRAHEISLVWSIRDPSGLPIFKSLRPWHVIQLIRLMDEVVTNAVKHAGAKSLTVTIETLSDPAGIPIGRITIEDDGHGFAGVSPPGPGLLGSGSGRGLLNMQGRAALCDIGFLLDSGPAGTRVVLTLPASFPSQPIRSPAGSGALPTTPGN
jgi:signal transduction histidine kinase